MAISNGITMIYYIADATLRTTKKPDMQNGIMICTSAHIFIYNNGYAFRH